MESADLDHELMYRIAQSDSVAYRQLVAKHLNFCVRFAERMLGNRQDAEDITQEACLKIWNEAPKWEARAKFSTWLYRVMFNACIDHKRKIVPFSVVNLDELQSQDMPSDERLMRQQRSQQVQAALANLPDRQRAALVLSYYEEVSNQQGADIMGIELGAFQQLLFRARSALKDILLEGHREQANG